MLPACSKGWRWSFTPWMVMAGSPGQSSAGCQPLGWYGKEKYILRSRDKLKKSTESTTIRNNGMKYINYVYFGRIAEGKHRFPCLLQLLVYLYVDDSGQQFYIFLLSSSLHFRHCFLDCCNLLFLSVVSNNSTCLSKSMYFSLFKSRQRIAVILQL